MNTSFTFALLKPDAVANPIVLKYISQAIHESGLVVSKGCRMKLTYEQAANLYSIHNGKFFYSRLIRHVCSGPVIAMKLQLRNQKSQESKWKKYIMDWLFPAQNDLLSKVSTKEENEFLRNEDAIIRWRRLLGPSKLFANCYRSSARFGNQDFNNFRNFFALSDTRNCGHGSDSSSELFREYAIFKEFLVDVTDDAELFEFKKMVVEETGESEERESNLL